MWRKNVNSMITTHYQHSFLHRMGFTSVINQILQTLLSLWVFIFILSCPFPSGIKQHTSAIYLLIYDLLHSFTNHAFNSIMTNKSSIIKLSKMTNYQQIITLCTTLLFSTKMCYIHTPEISIRYSMFSIRLITHSIQF